MSAVWLHIGQCGNQIGWDWWNLITRDDILKTEGDRYPFFNHDSHLAAVFVDSEPKVLRRLQRKVQRRYLQESNLIFGRKGRGSNWAYGYHGPHSETEETSLLCRTMECLRKEVEKRDCYNGMVMLHSLSGGTGSGLGAHLCEAVRDEYPLGHILSVSVSPYRTGECPLQHYNSLLCLSWLQRCGISIGMEPWELLRSVCPVPSTKFLCLNHISKRGTAFWDSMSSSVVHMLQRQSHLGKPYYSTSVLAVARGNHDNSFFSSVDSVLSKLKQGYRCASWNPFPIDYWTDPQNVVDPLPHSQSLTVCANHSSVTGHLQHVIEKARAMYQSRGYLHWYWKYGCEDEDFQEAFETLQFIVDSYNSAEEQ
ncbi:tubulin delta chain-like [Protopterus annectens]|uniref:tubulin delta chain-like n=1 Tax=Protopterus annectens TaxID=7888 RepID=UPI001CFB74F0|nr:tubulin delta chain-like [Protopterus annectens]